MAQIKVDPMTFNGEKFREKFGLEEFGDFYMDGDILYCDKLESLTESDVADCVVDVWLPVRKKRNQLLEESDWTQLDDAPLDDTKKSDWKAYRKALRDIPEDYSDVEEVIFPTPPE